MREIVRIVPIVLYLLVGALSSVMAYRSIFSDRLVRFHEKAAGIPWEEIDRSLQAVVLALMRVSGLGFLVVGVLLVISPVVDYFSPHLFLRYGIPLIAVMFCAGLFLVNYSLHRKASAATPLKGSLYAVLILLAGIAISSAR
jgi:uncharacterized membrane protein